MYYVRYWQRRFLRKPKKIAELEIISEVKAWEVYHKALKGNVNNHYVTLEFDPPEGSRYKFQILAYSNRKDGRPG